MPKLTMTAEDVLMPALVASADPYKGRIAEIYSELLNVLPGAHHKLVRELEELTAKEAWAGVEVAVAFGIRAARDPMSIVFHTEPEDPAQGQEVPTP